MGGDLADRKCLPCNGETPAVPVAERPGLVAELAGWSLAPRMLTRTISTAGFAEAVELVNRITPLAESEGHHPDLHISYGSLRIELTTHAIDDLSDNDFILAAKINRLLGPAPAGD